ncbi:hypothetical protein [Gilliamella apis]|uniref:hypothetical protein n=1 Tax=Gilliamella apis TaxID=1970738 RepID=UPI00080DE0A7|nr:hypothetical protein [Gilliamella apis]OCG06017.1 hypothetical protein A9G19_01525 [Gilliamella apis]
MIKDQIILKNSIKTLKMFLVEMHDAIDSSKRKELEEVIKQLENYQEDYTPAQLMDILSKWVGLIPVVIQMIEFLSKK